MNIIDAGESSQKAKVDAHYDSLKCDLRPLDPTSDEFKMVKACVCSNVTEDDTDHVAFTLPLTFFPFPGLLP